MRRPESRKTTGFVKELLHEIRDDDLTNSAGTLAFFLMLAIFPAMIFLLGLLPYLPIAHLDQAIMDLLKQAMPGEAADLLSGTVRKIATTRHSGLLSFGAIATIWAASSGMYAVIQQINVAYDLEQKRPFWKARGLAILLTFLFGALVISALALVVLGGQLQSFIGDRMGWSDALLVLFAAARWVIIVGFLLLALALLYYLAPETRQRFRWVSAGAIFAVVGLVVASLLFRFYVERLGTYDKAYGSVGAVIVLMMWLYVAGLVVLLGAEINALVAERSAARGRRKEPGSPRERAAEAERRGEGITSPA